MKRKMMRMHPDGTREVYEEHDEAPAMHKVMTQSQAAKMGHKGDTELAHVNPWEEALLKKLGGAGTRNPHTGLKQFYGSLNDFRSFAVGSPEGDAENKRLAAYYATNPASIPVNASTNGDFFNMPLDIMPTSTSTSNAGGTNTSQNQSTQGSQQQAQNTSNQGAQNTASNESYSLGTSNATNQAINQATNFANNQAQNTAKSEAQNTAQQQSTAAGQTYGGLPKEYQEAILASIVPQITGLNVQGIGANYDEATGQAFGGYQQLLNNNLKTTIPAALTTLANRGILNSTEGQKVLSGVISAAVKEMSDKGYSTAMQNAMLKANIPTVLAQLAELGKTTYGTNQAQSTGVSQGTSTGVSQGTASGVSGGQSTGSSSGASTSRNEANARGTSQGTSFGNAQGTSSGTSFGNSSGSSAGTTFSNAVSNTQDPTVMYRAMADLIKAMM